MQLKFGLTGLSLFLLSPALAQQISNDSSSTVSAPSMELLEFLADFGEIDESTFEMIEYHAERDLEKDGAENTDDQHKMPEIADEK